MRQMNGTSFFYAHTSQWRHEKLHTSEISSPSAGQLSRGQCVPEFEELVFRLSEGELAVRLLETRFGLHIVQVLRRVAGRLLPFEAVKSEIAAYLDRQSSQRATHQYLHILVGQAKIEGLTMEGADSPLVQ